MSKGESRECVSGVGRSNNRRISFFKNGGQGDRLDSRTHAQRTLKIQRGEMGRVRDLDHKRCCEDSLH